MLSCLSTTIVRHLADDVTVTGVPLSNQWGQQGYFYPVQIAQYGLSHYSKYVKKSAKSSRPVVIEDAEDGTSSRWSTTGDAAVHNTFDADAHSRVIQFKTSGEKLFNLSAIMSMLPAFSFKDIITSHNCTSRDCGLTCSIRKPAVDAPRPLRKTPVDGHAR